MTRHLHLIVRIAFAVVLLVIPSTPSNVSANGQPSSPIRLVYGELPPYFFTDASGKAQGFAISLAKALARELGREIEFFGNKNPTEMIQMLANGEADMTTLLALTEPRLEVAPATEALGAFQMSAFVLRSRNFESVTDLSGMRVGVVRGAIAQAAIEAIPFARPVEFRKTDDMIIPLLTGEVDAIVSASSSLQARLRKAGIDPEITQLSPPLLERPYGFYVAPSNAPLLEQLDRAIAESISPADMRALDELWFGRPTRRADGSLPFWGAAALGVLACVAGIALVRAHLQKKTNHKLRQARRSDQLLLDALNKVDAGIVIYGEEMQALLWNKALNRGFPHLTPLLERAAQMHDVIVASHGFGSESASQDKAKAEVFAESVTKKLVDGQDVTRIEKTEAGRVFEVSEFCIGVSRYASVYVDVSRLFEQASEIDEQRRDLEKANEQLQLFSSIAAHDLKSPLQQQQALLSFVREDLEEEGFAFPEDVDAQFAMVEDLTKKMQTLVSDLLQHARADVAMGICESIDVNERLPDIIALAALPSGFNVEIAPSLPVIKAEPAAFDVVLRNLISNAAKHHDRDFGNIAIRATELEGWVSIEVEDDGPGIPAEYREMIFEPFKRLSSEQNGSGLGLSFIRKTIESWGGSVVVEPAKRRGSVFVVTLPKSARTPRQTEHDVTIPAPVTKRSVH